MSFNRLIELTKEIEAGGKIACQSELTAKLIEERKFVFADAKAGDDLFLISGRCFGADDDSAAVYIAADVGAAEEEFIRNVLDEEPASDEPDDDEPDDDSEPAFFIITSELALTTEA